MCTTESPNPQTQYVSPSTWVFLDSFPLHLVIFSMQMVHLILLDEKGFSDKSGDSKFAEIIQEHQTRATSPTLGITKARQHKDGQLHIFKGQNPENRTFF